MNISSVLLKIILPCSLLFSSPHHFAGFIENKEPFDNFTPEIALQNLIQGNDRFLKQVLLKRNSSKKRQESAKNR